LELVRCASRPYIFTASPSPSIIASTRIALQTIQRRTDLRVRLWENADFLYKRLHDMGFALGPERSPIIAVLMREKRETITFCKGLLERGVYVNMVLPPATPDGAPLLRCSVSAEHSKDQLERVCAAFHDLRPSLESA
jgi:8-amino-7-oxononanoate synthase